MISFVSPAAHMMFRVIDKMPGYLERYQFHSTTILGGFDFAFYRAPLQSLSSRLVVSRIQERLWGTWRFHRRFSQAPLQVVPDIFKRLQWVVNQSYWSCEDTNWIAAVEDHSRVALRKKLQVELQSAKVPGWLGILLLKSCNEGNMTATEVADDGHGRLKR